MSENSKKPIEAATSFYVEVSEIRDSVIILREGQMRSIIAVSSANFALKSQQEQDAIIGSFQGILNSLSFPIQILVQSRKLDLGQYLEKLKQIESNQHNDFLKIKMREYIEYIQEMLREVNIMNKDFFLIVGYEPINLKEDLFGRFFRALNPSRDIKQKEEDFLKNRKILMNRASEITSRFLGIDLKGDLLNTEQLIALLYNSYNPDTQGSVRLKDVGNIDLANF